MSIWKKVRLSDISTSMYGYTASASTEAVGPKFLRITDIQDRVINWDSVPYCAISEKEYEKYKLYKNDIVVARTGNSTGTNAIIKEDIDAVFASYLIRFRVNEKIADPYFVASVLSSKSFTEFVNQVAGGSAQKGANANILGTFEVSLPPLGVQQRIASIIRLFDDKIELNRRMNETLEQMAMALYKHWFVDFGPFQDGESDIPQGWEYSPIEKLISEIESGDWGADKWTEKTPHQVICIRGTDIPQVRTGNDVKAPLRFIKQKSFEKKILKPGDIVLEASGGSPSQSTGRPVLITKGIISRFNVPLTCSNFCKIIRPSSKNFSYYLYLHFMDSYEQNVFFSYENGTTGIKNLDINSYIKQNYIAIPPINIIDEFNQAVEDLFEQIQRNAIETDYLKETRDYLLSRLLSGEIEVREAEEQVEEVLANA